MATTYPPSRTDATGKAQAPVTTTQRCCRCGCAPQACTCCELVCFERPEYHCGHLLTDADLALQVRYVVEKNKLRNRTLHGHGVVCGLKLTCDPLCCDHILLHEGYAIDDCGNDIVVCETTRFDVIAALKAKHLLVKAHERDPCAPKQEHKERECCLPQCFYITICYEEEDAQYQTPFQAGCASGPQDCVPTRVKERFRLEVTDERPHAHSYLERLEHKLRHCFRLFLDSPVGRVITANLTVLQEIAAGQIRRPAEGKDGNCEKFCLLKAHFQQLLKSCPDELSCRLAKEVACLHCPEDAGDNYGPAMADAFSKLFELMHRYQYDCALADLVFCCEAPEEACCVPLGCVQIEDGCITRVDNAPRDYVLSFANLIPVLTYEILTAAAEGKHSDDKERRERDCCGPAIEFNHAAFLEEFAVHPSGRYLTASALPRAIRAMRSSFASAFAFTDSRAFAPALFQHVGDTKTLGSSAEALGLSMSEAPPETELAALNPLQALLSESLMRRNDRLRGYLGPEGAIRTVLPDYEVAVTPERTRPTFEQLLFERDRTIAELTRRMDELQKRMDALPPRHDPATPA